MKTLKLFLLIVIITTIGGALIAQTTSGSSGNQKTETFKVWGECDMCKSRIEKTVKAEGATSAAWDEKSQLLTVTYDPSKTNKDGLSKKLATVGHDTEKYKADDKVYEALPGCCHYDRAK